MSYRIAFYQLEEGRGIKLLGHGRVPGEELVAANGAFQVRFADAFERAEYWLSDYRTLDAGEITADHSMSIAAIAAATGRAGLLLAMLCTRELEFGMTRMWEAQAAPTGWQISVFYDAAKMNGWFQERMGRGVDPDGGVLLMEWPPQ